MPGLRRGYKVSRAWRPDRQAPVFRPAWPASKRPRAASATPSILSPCWLSHHLLRTRGLRPSASSLENPAAQRCGSFKSDGQALNQTSHPHPEGAVGYRRASADDRAGRRRSLSLDWPRRPFADRDATGRSCIKVVACGFGAEVDLTAPIICRQSLPEEALPLLQQGPHLHPSFDDPTSSSSAAGAPSILPENSSEQVLTSRRPRDGRPHLEARRTAISSLLACPFKEPLAPGRVSK